MPKIAIVTDSTADLRPEQVQDLGIHVVPLTVHMGDADYLDGVELKEADLLAYLKSEAPLPTTSQPSPADFVDLYRRLAQEGYDGIISVHISEEMSGTINGARIAADQVQKEIPVRVFDSRSATAGLGIQILRLADYLKKDPDFDRACRFLESLIGHTKVYFLLGSLDNLSKGGRIGKASYLVGSLLQVKPILRLENGVISVHDKLRTRKNARALSYLVNLLDDGYETFRARDGKWLVGYNNDALGQELKAMLAAQGFEPDYPDMRMGAVVSTHIGMDAVGIFISTTEGDDSHVTKA